MTPASRSRAALTKRSLRIAFGIVIGVVLSAQVLRYTSARGVNLDVDRIFTNSLASIRLLGRIDVEVDRWRILIDRHILEEQLPGMASLDAQISAVRAALADEGRQYEPLVAYPGERVAWERLKKDIADAEQGAAPVLAASRKNLDGGARAEMARVEPTFLAIENDIDTLVQINQAGAVEATARIQRRQRESLLVSASLSLLAAIVTLIIAAVVIPLVGKRQEEIESHSIQLENRNRELDAFAGRVAHDLRGPLTAINLSASRLSERVPREEGATAILQRGIRRMEGLIEDLLTLSRIDAQLPGLASTAEVALAVESDLLPGVRDADGVLHVDVEPAEVRCSAGLLREVLWNLGENAVKYRRPGAPLTVDIVGRAVGGDYQFRVTDNGLGMSPEVAQRAFEPFFRGGQSRETPGTGLGLSIVKRVIEASGGTLSVDSKSQEGTTFLFTLPLAPTGA